MPAAGRVGCQTPAWEVMLAGSEEGQPVVLRWGPPNPAESQAQGY